MKKRRLTILILGLGLTLLVQTGLAQDNILTIATFNCEFLTRPKVHVKFGLPFNIGKATAEERQEWDQPGFRDQQFNEAAKEVAKVITMVNADVIALTEVGDETDVAELQNEIHDLGLDYPHRAVGRSRDTFTRQHVGILSKFLLNDIVVEIPGREIYVEEPDDPEREDDTGISKGMRVSFVAFGREFLLYVVHLASEAGGYDQDQQRIAQASILRRHYLREIKEGELVIVAGDLNDRRGQPAVRRIRGLDDIHEDLIQTGHKGYFDDRLDTRWTYEFEGIREQIDHILLSFSVKNACKRSGISARTIDHENELASDHRPLVVTLKLKDE